MSSSGPESWSGQPWEHGVPSASSVPPERKKLPRWVGNTLAGMSQATLVTIVGYPFDLVKVKMQAKRKTPYASNWSCVKDVLQKEGMVGFYRGSAMPWISHMIKRPAQFPVSEYLKARYTTTSTSQWERTRNNYIIGAGCGLIGPLFGTPLQVVKVGMQTSSVETYGSSLAYAKHVIQTRGLVGGLYRGFIPTAVKDCVFGGSFVGTYYTLRDLVGTDGWHKNFFNGAAAHCITWFLFIPIDYVKTNIQRSTEGTRPTISGVIRSGYQAGGIRVFWKGVGPACLRTIPVSGIAMTGYEMVRKVLLDKI